MSGAPLRVRLQTGRFALRGLNPSDATPRAAAWLADPAIAAPLNRPALAPEVSALAAEFGTANGTTRFMIGIFVRDDGPGDGAGDELGDAAGAIIGFYTINRDPAHRTATFNVVIGERDWWGRGVVLETRAALLDHFFAERGVDKAIGQPHARNFASVFNYKRQGWVQEGVLRAHSLAANGAGRLDQVQFGLLASEWAALRGRPAPGDGGAR